MAGDIRVQVGFFTHPKTKMLRRRIGSEAPMVLMRLWFWAAENRHEGHFTGMTDDMIEDAADWEGAPGDLVKALKESRFLDGEEGDRALHDWQDHQPWVCNRELRRARGKTAALARWARATETASAGIAAAQDATSIATSMQDACEVHAGSNAPNPDPYPTHTQPNPTKAKPTRAALALPEWLPPVSWSAYVEMRKRIRAPLTDRAIELNLGELEKLRAQGHDPAAVLDQSVMNGWKGLFAPKASRAGPVNGKPPRSTYLDDPQRDNLVATMKQRMETAT